MPWTKDEERAFRRELVKAFETEAKARMVLRLAEVNTARVDFSGGAESMWFNAMSEATRAAKLDALLDAAIAEASDPGPFEQVRDRVRPAAQPSVSYVVPSTPDAGIDWDGMNGPQLGRLSDAIQDAFPGPDALRLFLQYSLGKNLYAIAGNGPLPAMVYDVLIDARAKGSLGALYAAALGANPSNKKLAAFAKGASVSRVTYDPQGHVQLESVAGASALQAAVPGATPYQDLEGMILAMSRIRGQVCRVEVGGTPVGTGFLLGPSTVLTNWHVVHNEATGQACAGASVVLRFDFLRAKGAIVHQGTEFRLEAGWLLDALPPTAAERGLAASSALPTPDELDYALLRVAGDPGDSPVGGDRAAPGAAMREWVRLAPGKAALALGSQITVVQHALAEPLSAAWATSAIVNVNANETRVRYAVHTERGSSGSPCFDKDWSLVALHHSGQAVVRPRFNEGVPINTIRERLIARGFWRAVGN